MVQKSTRETLREKKMNTRDAAEVADECLSRHPGWSDPVFCLLEIINDPESSSRDRISAATTLCRYMYRSSVDVAVSGGAVFREATAEEEAEAKKMLANMRFVRFGEIDLENL